MPVATHDQYLEMLNRAKTGGYAYPAINVASSSTLIAAIQGFAEAGSDGILQVSTGGAEFWSGSTVKNMAYGAQGMAAFAREIAKGYGITVALHTDHCAKDQLDKFVRPLIAVSEERVKAGLEPLFNSHMWDGSAVSLKENLEIAQELLAKTKNIGVVLEVEIGAVGGEEDGVKGASGDRLFSTVADGMATAEALGLGEKGKYITALTFGNVHGVYKSGNVKLRPELLEEIQREVGLKYGVEKPFDLVFHGGSGSTEKEISDSVKYGVIKMNIDTDTQYAYTRAIAGHMFTNYDGVLKVDGDVGNKKVYDPRAWGKTAEAAMAARVVLAAQELGSAGKSISL